MEERLQKIISARGIASRRSAEKMIEEGRVSVNGCIAYIGMKADDTTDEILIDGTPVKKSDPMTYIMLNKPVGYVTTMSDEMSRKTVSDLVSDLGYRVYPVGRLDKDSCGLLIMTNDGDLANKLMHPSHEKNKKYIVNVEGNTENIPLLSKEMDIDGYTIKPAEVKVLSQNDNSAKIEIIIHEGRNRQIRKMCEQSSLHVTSLKRVSVGKIELGDLKSGKWRYLTEAEVELLKN